MLKRTLLALSLIIFAASCFSQNAQNKVKQAAFKIIDKDNSEKTFNIAMTIPTGPKNVGGTKETIKTVQKILTENGVDCPPKRQSLGNNTWLCGNGKKIKTENPKLIELFSEAWDENE